MVWMFSGIVFIAQIICCVIFKDKLKRYLPTLIALFFITGRAGAPADGKPDAGLSGRHRCGGAVPRHHERLEHHQQTT